MVARIIFCTLLIVAGETQAPWMGTWKLNPAKSQTASDRYKRTITKIEPWQDGIKVEYDMIGFRGGVNHLEWVGKFDSKDYPVEGADYVITNAYTVIDDHHYRIVVKVEGHHTATADVAISSDGKTLTTVTTEGEKKTTSVYERQ
jgi:hypothetical protein